MSQQTEQRRSDMDAFGAFTEEMWFSKDERDPKPTQERDLPIMALGLSGECGEVLEHIKKLIRDGKLDREALRKELGDVLYYWARICRYFDFWPSEVAAVNEAKLRSRRERGTLRGDGDNR